MLYVTYFKWLARNFAFRATAGVTHNCQFLEEYTQRTPTVKTTARLPLSRPPSHDEAVLSAHRRMAFKKGRMTVPLHLPSLPRHAMEARGPYVTCRLAEGHITKPFPGPISGSRSDDLRKRYSSERALILGRVHTNRRASTINAK